MEYRLIGINFGHFFAQNISIQHTLKHFAYKLPIIPCEWGILGSVYKKVAACLVCKQHGLVEKLKI
jgi:hypothetical protein